MNEPETKQPIRTEDGATLYCGDRAYNYYDMDAGEIASEPDDQGWFYFTGDRTGHELLNGQRICSIEFAQRRGFRGAER